ncbi:hypothetical protein Q8A73_020237 [Channa argus]|nr:hypothetical protein Q8A73_020237 [Channa argus]
MTKPETRELQKNKLGMEETKQIKRDHLKSSEDRWNSTTRTMETDNMDETVSSLVSEIVQQSVSDLNELMQLVKHWEADERVTSHTDDSVTGCSTQQKTEEYLTWFFDQRRTFAENLSDEENKEVKMVPAKITAKGLPYLSTISENKRKSSSTSSPSSISAILELTNVAVAQGTEQADWTLESTDSDSKAEQSVEPTLLKRLKKTWSNWFGRKKNNEDGSVSESQEDEDIKDRKSVS